MKIAIMITDYRLRSPAPSLGLIPAGFGIAVKNVTFEELQCEVRDLLMLDRATTRVRDSEADNSYSKEAANSDFVELSPT